MNKNIKFPVHIIATAALITNNEGKILLLKNRRRGWEFPGGQVENGENLIEACIREVKEETGVDVEIDSIVGLYSNTEGYDSIDKTHYIPTKLMVDFTGHVVDNDKLIVSDEHEDIAWVTKEDAFMMVKSPHTKIRIKNMIDNKGELVYQAYKKVKSQDGYSDIEISLDTKLSV